MWGAQWDVQRTCRFKSAHGAKPLVGCAVFRGRRRKEPVDAPEKGGFARTGWTENQDVVVTGGRCKERQARHAVRGEIRQIHVPAHRKFHRRRSCVAEQALAAEVAQYAAEVACGQPRCTGEFSCCRKDGL
jgi:hypothetical protein